MNAAKLGVAGLVLAALVGCTGARSASDVSRDIARGAVLVAIEAIEYGDEACAGVAALAKGGNEADLRKGIEIARTCERAKEAGLAGAKAARMAIQAWGSVSARQLACAGAQMASALNLTRDAIVRGGGDVPAVVEDGIAGAAMLARMLPTGGSCELSTGSTGGGA